MTEIEVTIRETAVSVTKTGAITAGMVGVPVRFQFGESWDGLTVVAVFKGGSVVRDRLLDETRETTVPHECLAKPGVALKVGAEGRNAAGDLVIPTVWGVAGLIHDSAQSSGDPGTDPGNPVWADLKAELEQVRADIPTDTESRLASIEKDIADLKYVPISITSFAHNAGTRELGDTVSDVTLSWALNKAPTALTLDGEAIGTELRTITLSGLSIIGNKTWTLAATDERDAVASKTTGVTFYNGVYYGAAAAPESLDSAFVLALTKVLSDSRKRTVTVSAADGQYIWYCVPSRLGECTFAVGGFEGGFDLVATMDFTNASGYTEPYYIYRSANAGLGSTSVEVS